MTRAQTGARPADPGAWVGSAAFAAAVLNALPSFYWSLGGTAGLATVGQWAVTMDAARDPLVMAGLFVIGLMKVAAGVLALALTRPWGWRFPPWLLLAAGWGGALLLTVYGALQTGSQALVALRIYPAPADLDRYALNWHLFLWSPWFLVWGILLGLATRVYRRSRD